MFYEEKIVDGIMYWRTAPDSEWIPVDSAKLSDRIIDRDNKIAEQEEEIAALVDILVTVKAEIDDCSQPQDWNFYTIVGVFIKHYTKEEG